MNEKQERNLFIQINQTRLILRKLWSISIRFPKRKTKVYQIHDSIIIERKIQNEK
jgi:hypothetical protein